MVKPGNQLVGETGASCNKIYYCKYCTSVDCPFDTFMVPK